MCGFLKKIYNKVGFEKVTWIQKNQKTVLLLPITIYSWEETLYQPQYYPTMTVFLKQITCSSFAPPKITVLALLLKQEMSCECKKISIAGNQSIFYTKPLEGRTDASLRLG